MFCPIPDDSGRTDDDCASVVWKRGRKRLVMNLNCYGSTTIRCGLAYPAGGSVLVDSFEDAWKWYCSEEKDLPEKDKHAKN